MQCETRFKMSTIEQGREIICKQCKKQIMKNSYECEQCLKDFHKSCAEIHKKYNSKNELVKCNGKIIERVRSVLTPNRGEERGVERVREDLEDTEETELALTLDQKIDRVLLDLETLKANDAVTEMNISKTSPQILLKNEIKTFKQEIKIIIVQEIKKEIRNLIQEELKVVMGTIIEDVKELTSTVKNMKHEQIYTYPVAPTIGKDVADARSENMKVTYADKIKKSCVQEIIVTPMTEQTNEKTMGEIKSNIDIMSLGIGVSKIRNGGKGKIILGCEKGYERETLSAELKNKIGTNYTVTSIKKQLPKIKIVGIGEDLNFSKEQENDFLLKIIEQNEIRTEKEELSLRMIKKTVNTGVGTIIVETDPKTHKIIIEKGKIKVGWKICPVYNFVSVLQCYKCWGYHHFAKDCRNKTNCRKCAGQHEQKDCTERIRRCTNCCYHIERYKETGLSTDHEATDKICEIYKQMISRAQKNTTYNGK